MLQSGTSTATGLIPVLRYRDVAAATDWLCRTFGFEFHRQVEDEDGEPIYVQLRCGQDLVILVPVGHSDLDGLMCQPDEAGGLETQACYVVVPDVVAHHAAATAAGATVVLDLTEDDSGSWGYSCSDLEGHVWSFGAFDPIGGAAPEDTVDAVATSSIVSAGASDEPAIASATELCANTPSNNATWLKRTAIAAAGLLLIGGTLAFMSGGQLDGSMAERAQAKIAGPTETDGQETRSDGTTLLERQLAAERAARTQSETAAAEAETELKRLRQQLGTAKQQIDEQTAKLAAEREARKKAEQSRTALAKEIRARQETAAITKHNVKASPGPANAGQRKTQNKSNKSKATAAKSPATASIGNSAPTKPPSKLAGPKKEARGKPPKKTTYKTPSIKKTQPATPRTASSVPGSVGEPSNPWNDERWPYSEW